MFVKSVKQQEHSVSIDLKFVKLLFLLILTLLSASVTFSQTTDDVYRWGNLKDNPWSVNEYKINSKYFYENTIAVIAPGENKSCPNGKTIVMTGSKREDRRMIVSDLFTNGTQNKLNENLGTDVTLDINSDIETLATDNQIVKLNDGSLLAVKLGYLWSPITPKPFWWDWTSDKWTFYKKGARDAIFIYKSTNCGVTWNNISKIDSAKIGFGIPKSSDEKAGEDDDDDDETENPEPNNEKLYHTNGFDRQEVYYDKWTEKIYITTQMASGGYSPIPGVKVPSINKYGVLMSSDNGQTWSLLKNGFTDKSAMVMTTTTNGRFFMFSASGGKPVLYFTRQKRDFDLSSLDSVNISCKKDYPLYPDKAQKDKQIHQWNKIATFSIARGHSQRIGTSWINSVYISYPVFNHLGKGELMIVKVDFIEPDFPNTILTNQNCYAVKASDKDHSLGYGTFVESTEEGVNFKKGLPFIAAKTLFFYAESTTGDNFKGEKKAAFKGILIDNRTNSFSDDFFLSKDNNKNRWFTANNGVGHYTKGAYFVHQQTQNYAVQWSEPDGIHVSVISGLELKREDDKKFLENHKKYTKKK